MSGKEEPRQETLSEWCYKTAAATTDCIVTLADGGTVKEAIRAALDTAKEHTGDKKSFTSGEQWDESKEICKDRHKS